MRIVIAGAGTIGTNLASALVKEGQDVIVIDSDERALAQLEASTDCQTVAGDATSALVLEELGLRHTDLVVAVTNDDAKNMTVCRLAEFYNVPQKLARLRNPEYTDPDCPIPSEHFGIDHIISPEGLAVELIDRLVACPGAREAIDFERGRIALRAFVVTDESPIAGERIIDIDQSIDGKFLVAAIRRSGRVIVPDGKESLRVGDTVYVVSEPDMVNRLASAFDPQARVAKNAIIAGASVTGLQVARRLAGRLQRVTVIEADERLAHRAAAELDRLGAEVLCGSPLDIDLLTRSNFDNADYFLALSDNDESNFMSALLYRKYAFGVPIVLSHQLHYMDILESVDLDMVINPRVLAVSSLLRLIRGDQVLSAAKLHSEEIEALELAVGDSAPVAGIPIAKLQLPAGILMAAVLRDQSLHIPGGAFVLRAGDRVLVFADQRGLHQVEALFT